MEKIIDKVAALYKKYWKHILGGTLLVFAVFGVLFFFMFRHLSDMIATSESTTPVVTIPEMSSQEKYLLRTIEIEKDQYGVSVSYSQIKGTSSKVQEVNKQIAEIFENASSAFIKEMESVETEKGDLPAVLPKSFFAADTRKVFENEKTLSLLTEETFYNRGAAHPSHHLVTFVYDIESERLLTLSDVFVTGNGFYKKVRALLFEKEKKQLEEAMETKLGPSDIDWIREGLAADTLNLFTLTGGGITFYFDQYVLAPYSAGPQEVFISFEELKEFKK